MSYKERKRTKQIRQKTSTGYQALPIGADAALVDMFSSLDLEEELKLGGDHYVEIDQQGENIIIKEWYFSELRNGRTIQEMKEDNAISYTVRTAIQVTGGDRIEITLYAGDFDEGKVLHQKVILINEESATFTVVDENID